MIGRIITHYKVLDKLGSGGMGEVYLALDVSLDRKVALKFLSDELRRDPAARERLIQEARSAAMLDHPFICKIYEVAEAEGEPYIAMEYVEGKSLSARLLEGPLPLGEAIRVVIEAAEALEIAHERQIVHRDLKPGNIMLTRGGHLKVMDFGLAKRLAPFASGGAMETTAHGLTGPGAIVGTLDYMSPEQIRGLDVDTRSDIFSLDVVFYEVITGTHPFRRETPMETGSAILREPIKPLSRFTGDVPPTLEHVLRRMVAKDREDRYQATSELMRDLRFARAEPASGSGRRLAALMFTDIVGYSALVRRDESLAIELLHEHWQLLRSIFPRHSGREIKTIGDAFLVEFASTLEATQCAIEIQRTLVERNAAVAPERQIRLRIGLHLGDVIHREGDVFGDGVNIAARLKPLASPGGICVSEGVANQVANKIDFGLREIVAGVALENIERPMRVFFIEFP